MKLSFNFRKITDIFKKVDTLDRDTYRIAAIGFLGIIILMIISAAIAFFMSLHGEEQTLVPNVTDMEITSALIKLQEKELYPRISLRVTNDPEDKGRILDQKPVAGSIVKAGRRISLTVGKGSAVDKIGNYIGMNVNDVKLQLQAIFTTTSPLVTIKEPPIYIFDVTAASGTILEQKPEPGTGISGPVALELVISRGPEQAKQKVPSLTGLKWTEALTRMEKSEISYVFQVRKAVGKEKPGTIVSQLPASGTLVSQTQPVAIVFAFPDEDEGMVAGLIKQTTPTYPYPLKVKVTAKYPSGESVTLGELLHSGGEFTLPYNVPENTVISTMVLDHVISKFEAKNQ